MKFNQFYFFAVAIYSSCFVFSSEGAVCGTRSSGRGNAFGGTPVKKETPWPWLVALINWPKDELFCGGSLVSEKHVVSGECTHNT
jgi:hypothetical protein